MVLFKRGGLIMSYTTANNVPCLITREEAINEFRLKNGILQQAFKVDTIDKTTNAYMVYTEWRNVPEVGPSEPDMELQYASSNWPTESLLPVTISEV